ncbi:c-type cytochrome [Tautonia sociabilis]|uniref:C-type cytochrome n=2 Tax=Tautonia sociabilis TaxID=2080755 RepID=A0A432MMR1_9BACT|nr:c-type cytochrome [Tautonia sociabilis]
MLSPTVPTARAQVGPEESAARVIVADGLEATLWAAEPMVVNPTTIDIDSRGRVWVTEGLNYRPTRNPKFDRIDGADAIKILEDTDGDGTADTVTVFADSIFPVPMGIAVEERYDEDGRYAGCRVYVGNSPNLLVLEDTDGDDRADARYPLLTGFGGIDSDHGVHGMVLGLDGKLYFTHGDGCCSVQPDGGTIVQNFDVTDASGRRVSTDQLATTLRVNRDGTQFEVIADRQRNNYETSLNSFGNIFTSDNDDDGNRGSRVIWVMDGGSYGYRTPGSPRHWGEDVPGNVPKLVGTGNGSPCGIMVYEGSLLPEGYFGGVFEADAGTRQINFFPITRHGAAFRTEYKVLMSSDDPWFRPVDMASAPDGSLFVADWYDAGVGGHAFSDQTTGRIYRVAPRRAEVGRPAPDFGTIGGLIEALKSPVVATQDAARRGLIARGEAAVEALNALDREGEPIHRARALWVRHAIQGDEPAIAALSDADPRLREQAVRILGRDVSREGTIEFQGDARPRPPSALGHLDALLSRAIDPDPGVRRELILALRDLPTDQVGDALRELASSWDGRDRWYLEALGLALRDREPDYLAQLFDGTLYGDLDLDAAGGTAAAALPPYFPVDRNEAFLATGEELPPANALSKTLGLMWELHGPEVLPLLSRILPRLATSDLRQAADDVLAQVSDPAGAVALADLLFAVDDPVRERQVLATLARRLAGDWREAADDPRVRQSIAAAIDYPGTRAEGIAAAAATGDRSHADKIMSFVKDTTAPLPVRIAAVEALGSIRPPDAREMLEALIGHARQSGGSDPVAEAALRTLPELGLDRDELVAIVADDGYPLGLRREALRAASMRVESARLLLDRAGEGALPDDLKAEATTMLNAHPDRDIRRRAAEVLPLAGIGGDRPLPSFEELLSRRGDPERGRIAFSSAGESQCADCHRVQGRGQWVGPDLSTIGTKYGRDGLLTSILSPSAAIGYNYRSYVLALADGRVVTGLPVEESADRLVLKTAEGQRIAVDPAEIDEKRVSDVSLMPEGLAQQMTDEQLVDLLAFLETLRKPVSIVGEFQAVGPLAEVEGEPAVDPSGPIDTSIDVRGADGRSQPWRRLRADAEGRVDLSALVGDDPKQAVYLHAPIVSPADLPATLVIDSPAAGLLAWLDGRPLELTDPSGDDPTRSVEVDLSRGAHDLILRLPCGADSGLVATFVADAPLEFRAPEGRKVSSR